MSTNMKIGLVVGVIGLLFGLILVFSGIGWYNTAVKLEETVKAQWSENQNQYDSFWKKVKEVAQVPDKYKEDFKDLLVSETKAKFGEQGSQAAFQWFKDRDINFSDKMYVRVQDVIESGRNDFKRSQTDLLDKQRTYSVHTKTFFGRMLGGFFGMPQEVHGKLAPNEDLDGDGKLTVLDYPIVTSKKTKQVFESGEENEPVNVFGK